MTVLVTGTFRFPPQNVDAAQDAMTAVILASRSEDGCLAYSYSADLIEPGLFHVFEEWTDRAALVRHFKQPHERDWMRLRDEMGFSDRSITLHELANSETL